MFLSNCIFKNGETQNYVDCIIEIVKFYDILEIYSQLLSGENNNNIFNTG